VSSVHIIAAEWDGDHVLARLARTLADGAGWSIGASPDPNAAVNNFFPYIWYAQRHADFNATLTAAYFSHHDTQDPTKDSWWHTAASAVNLRIVTAHKYGHEVKGYGPTAYAHAPIDPQFMPAPRTRPARPVVGVSGFVYGDGRKGEGLVSRLVHSKLGKRLDWLAAGQGWPTPRVHHYAWMEMPAFYQNLDVYLCASTIEGVPMPTLEAMACGVRVVIPRGVGMLDELPDLPDVYRFEAGNYDSLAAALELAALDWRPTDGAAQAEAVRAWNGKQWVIDHQEAIDRLVQPAFPAETLKPWREGRAGAFYVAYGEPARECVKRAVASWKRYMPDVPVAVVSDSLIPGVAMGNGDAFIEQPDADIGARGIKVRIYELAPRHWEYVLYLDADTEIVADVSFLFDALQDGWELVITKNPAKYHTTRRMGRPDNQEEVEATFNLIGSRDLLQWNGGVFAFRRSARVAAFFERWYAEWQRWGSRDQAALLRALWRGPLRIYTLGNEWNTVTHYIDPERTAGILHYPQQARRYSGIIYGRLDSPQAWEKVKR